jgi:hypothetical protein
VISIFNIILDAAEKQAIIKTIIQTLYLQIIKIHGAAEKRAIIKNNN